jgi:hypothetical protein
VSLWLLLLVLTFATFRVTRLIVEDDFPPLLWLRVKIATARPTKTVKPARGTPFTDFWWLGQLITCPWCASAYVAGALVVITWAMVGMALPVLCWLAVWGAAAFVYQFTDR